MRFLAKLALAVAAVVVTGAIVVNISAQQRPNAESKQDDSRFEVQITDEMIRHSRIRDVLYFVGTGWSFAVLALLLVTGASNRIRDAAARVTAMPFPLAMV